MFIRPIRKKRPNGKVEETWALVESVRTDRGPRQRTVAYLGDITDDIRCGVKYAATKTEHQPSLFSNDTSPEWVEVDLKSLRVDRTLKFGAPWFGHTLFKDIFTTSL